MSYDLHVGLGLRDAGLHVKTAFLTRSFEYATFYDELAAFLLSFFNRI